MQALIKGCFATMLVMCICSAVQAQKLVFLFAHGQYASPVRTGFKDNYGYGLGAEAGIGLGAGKTFFTGTIGYTFFDARSGHDMGNITYVPMKVGVRRYLLPGNLLFIHADAGLANIKDKTTDSQSSRFTGDIGGGVKLGPMEVGVAYDGYSSGDGFNSWIGFKAGWRIGL